jgi:hypothetical protein
MYPLAKVPSDIVGLAIAVVVDGGGVFIKAGAVDTLYGRTVVIAQSTCTII